MAPKTKYKLFILGTIISFTYVLCTEVWDQGVECLTLYCDIQAKEQKVLSPEKLQMLKASAIFQKAQLSSIWMKGGDERFEESPTGVYEYLHHSAQLSNVSISSLVPLPSMKDSSSQVKDVPFRITLRAPYHNLGEFMNAIESGFFSVRVEKLSIRNLGDSKGSTIQLEADLEAVASVLTVR